PAVAAVLKCRDPAVRIAYLMTDGAALPLAHSNLVAGLKDKGLIDVTITCGHAFGRDLECVNVFSGLAAARHVGGPGAPTLAGGRRGSPSATTWWWSRPGRPSMRSVISVSSPGPWGARSPTTRRFTSPPVPQASSPRRRSPCLLPRDPNAAPRRGRDLDGPQ